MKSFNILLTCSSNKTQILEWIRLSVRKLNFKIKIYAADSNSEVLSKYFCDYFWNMPKINNNNFYKILNFCKKNKIRIIIPSSDKELIFWSKFKEKLKQEGIYVMVSSQFTIKTCLNKLSFYKKLSKFKSIIFTSIKLSDFSNKDKLVAKNKIGSGSKNIFLNKSKDEIKKNLDIKKKDYVFQKYFKGNEISIDCYFSSKNNKLINIVPRFRNIITSGESSLTTIIKKNLSNFDEIKKIGENFKFSGHIMFQCFLTKKGLQVFECNPRIGGASLVSFYNSMDSINYFILESIFPKKTLKFKDRNLEGSKLLIYKKTKFIK